MITRDELIDSYAESIIEGMDIKSMEQFVYDTITENLAGRTNKQLAEEVVKYNSRLFDLSFNDDLSDEEIVTKFVKANKNLD